MEDGFNGGNKEEDVMPVPVEMQKEIIDYAMPEIGLTKYEDYYMKVFHTKAKEHNAIIQEINLSYENSEEIMSDNNLIETRHFKQQQKVFGGYYISSNEIRLYYESGNGKRWCFLTSSGYQAFKALSADNTYFFYNNGNLRTYQFMTRAGAIMCDSQVGEEVKKTVTTIEDYIFLLTLIYNKKALYLNKAGAERLKKFPKLKSTFYRTSKSKSNDIWKLELQTNKRKMDHE